LRPPAPPSSTFYLG